MAEAPNRAERPIVQRCWRVLMSVRRLTRPRRERSIAGVCAGLANYFDVDVVLVRAAWVVFSIVPGAIIGGVLAYLAAWLLIPESPELEPVRHAHRLTRSTTDQRIAGVCGGLAEYFGVDATPIRLLWVILSIFCGAVIGGVIAYLLAWLIIPRAHDETLSTTAPASPAA
jgi:phage shock protein PspC (stress-responsive transcriptional regulator)